MFPFSNSPLQLRKITGPNGATVEEKTFSRHGECSVNGNEWHVVRLALPFYSLDHARIGIEAVPHNGDPLPKFEWHIIQRRAGQDYSKASYQQCVSSTASEMLVDAAPRHILIENDKKIVELR